MSSTSTPWSNEGARPITPFIAWYSVAVMALATVLSFLDRTILAVLAPLIQKDLGISDTQLSLLLGPAFMALYVFTGLVAGWLADHFNRRKILAAAIAFWSIMTCLCGTLRSFWPLFGARMGVGAGEAFLYPTTYSMVADMFPPDRRGRAIGVLTTSMSIGGGMALLLGGAILSVAEQDGFLRRLFPSLAPWQMVFLIIGPLGFVVTFLLLFTVREPARSGVTVAPDTKVSPKVLIAYLKAHAGALSCVLGANIGISLASTGVAAWMPTLLVRTYGMAASHAGVMLGAAGALGGFVGPLMWGHVSDHFAAKWQNRSWVNVIVFPLIALALLLIVIPTVPLVSCIGYAAIVFLSTGVNLTASASIQEIAPNQLRGQLLALNGLLANVLGYAVGPALVALVTDFIFKDQSALRWSMFTIAMPVYLLCILVSVRGARIYRSALLPQASAA